MKQVDTTEHKHHKDQRQNVEHDEQEVADDVRVAVFGNRGVPLELGKEQRVGIVIRVCLAEV